MFNKSHKGKMLSAHDLEANLIEVIVSNNILCESEPPAQTATPDAGAYNALKTLLVQRREKDREGRKIAKKNKNLTNTRKILIWPESVCNTDATAKRDPSGFAERSGIW